MRLQAEIDRLRAEVSLLIEEIRIKNARMDRIDTRRRPYYSPTERMAILELRAARGWSQQRTGDVFRVTAATIASWCRRLDEEGPQALVQLQEPVNRFPDYVRQIVRCLKLVCPTLGKQKIAQILARAGLHLGTTTVGRILRESPIKRPSPAVSRVGRTTKARCPDHIWHVDLTVVPTGSGFWASWLPWAMPQCWPFCCWLAVGCGQLLAAGDGLCCF